MARAYELAEQIIDRLERIVALLEQLLKDRDHA